MVMNDRVTGCSVIAHLLVTANFKSKLNMIFTVYMVYFQQLLSDERFQSSMESEMQCYWLPMQLLNAVQNTFSLPDVVQIDIMKVCVHRCNLCIVCICTKTYLPPDSLAM